MEEKLQKKTSMMATCLCFAKCDKLVFETQTTSYLVIIIYKRCLKINTKYWKNYQHLRGKTIQAPLQTKIISFSAREWATKHFKPIQHVMEFNVASIMIYVIILHIHHLLARF